MMYNLLKSDKKLLSYTHLTLKELAKSILRKIRLKFSKGSKAKSQSNIFSCSAFLNNNSLFILHLNKSIQVKKTNNPL